MKKERMNAHKRELAKRYGIELIDSFFLSARRYEKRLERINEMLCDDPRLANPKWMERMEAVQEEVEQSALKNLKKYCKHHRKFAKEFKTNRDPRGYALKLEADDLRASWIWCDWGGYGIIAPDITDN